MNPRLAACALLAGFAYGCSSSGTIPTSDAAAPDAYVPPTNDAGDASPIVDSATAPDSFVPPTDSGAPDATDAADAADAEPADASACAWDGSYESPACTECLRAECCGSAMTCETDPSCVALDQCVNGCITNGGADAGDGGDAGSVSTCAQSCFDSQPAKVQGEFQLFSHCLEAQCAKSGAGPCQ